MHEFDEICYGKTIDELRKEQLLQIHFGNDEALTTYIMNCIIRLKESGKDKVDWYYH